MEKKSIEYFNWKEIQNAICEEMGIELEYFRDYHKLVGGSYKDLWHEWLEYFDSEVRNYTITSCDLGETKESKLEWIVEEDGKEWLIPFVDAVYKVWDKYGIENIKYSW